MRQDMYLAGILALAFALAARAGDLTTDNLTVNQDATVHGSFTIPEGNTDVSTNGLILQYNFNTNTTPVADGSGCGNTGGVVGATWLTNGWGGGSYSFDGSDDYIGAGTGSGSLAVTGSALTTTAWIDWRSADSWDGWILSKMGPGSGSYGMYLQVGGGLCLPMDTGGGWADTISTASVGNPTGVWHFCACVYNGTNVTFYWDGQQLGNTVPKSGALVSKAYSLKVGWEDGSNSQRFEGRIDEIRIYARALNASEVWGLYSQQMSPSSAAVRFETGIHYVKPLGDVSMGSYTNNP